MYCIYVFARFSPTRNLESVYHKTKVPSERTRARVRSDLLQERKLNRQGGRFDIQETPVSNSINDNPEGEKTEHLPHTRHTFDERFESRYGSLYRGGWGRG